MTIDAGHANILSNGLQRTAHPVYRRLCTETWHTWRWCWHVGVVVIVVKNGLMAAFIWSKLSVLLRVAKDTKTTADRLHRILEFLNGALNVVFRFRPNAISFCQKIRLIPVTSRKNRKLGT